MSQEHLLNPQLAKELSLIRSITSFPLLDSCYDNLLQFLEPISERANNHLKKDAQSIRKEVIFVIGWPSSGKTRVTNFIEKNFSWWYSAYNPTNQEQLKVLGWEPHGEKVARAKGLVKTPVGDSFTDNELLASQQELGSFITDSLQNKKTEVIVVECPAGIAYNIAPDTLLGVRRLGADIALDIARRNPPYNQYDYNLNMCALVGGPLMPAVMAHFREDINLLDERKDLTSEEEKLQEAQRLAYIYGYKKIDSMPLTQKELESLKNGATLRQIKKIDALTAAMLKVLQEKGHLPVEPVTRYSQIIRNHHSYLKALTEAHGSELLYHWQLPWFLDSFMTQKDNLNLARENIFLGYNEPTPNDIGIDNPYHFEVLLNHLRSRKTINP